MTAYTLKYPANVEKLILISPAGVPLNPESNSTTQQVPTTNNVEAVAGAVKSELADGRKEMNAPKQGLAKEGSQPKEPPKRTGAARNFIGWASVLSRLTFFVKTD